MFKFFSSIKDALDRIYEAVMPASWLRLKARYQAAGIILILVALWIGSTLIVRPATNVSAMSVDKKTASTGDVPTVRVASLTASPRDATVNVRGRTEALHAVDVRAEVEGVVKAIHFDKGQKVRAGDVLCEIDINDPRRQGRADEPRWSPRPARSSRSRRSSTSRASAQDPARPVASRL